MKIYHVTEVLGHWFDWSKINDKILAVACLRGSAVHLLCSGIAKGFNFGVNMPDAWKGYVRSFEAWYYQNVVNVVLVEKSFQDDVLGFTGRVDFVFDIITGERLLVDIKTPAAESKAWGCQLAAYNHLVQEVGGIELDGMITLRLKANGGAAQGKRYEQNLLERLNVFYSALTACRGLTD